MHFLHFFDSQVTNKHNDTLIRKEKRWASRTPLWLKVSLFQNGTLTKFGLATNFSLSGLFILCNQNKLTPGQKLEIIFDHDCHGIEKHCYIPVEVARTTNDGVAVSFYEHDVNFFCCIQKVLSVSKMKNDHERTIHPEKAGKHEAA